MAGSIIAGDIVLFALARDDGDAARVKDFHLSLHYSEDRVSQVLKELVRDGWLTMASDDADRRMRKVHASDRLILLFGEYRRFLLELLGDVHVPTSSDRVESP
jgi:DNA-binding MarR family transcriptional regulator